MLLAALVCLPSVWSLAGPLPDPDDCSGFETVGENEPPRAPRMPDEGVPGERAAQARAAAAKWSEERPESELEGRTKVRSLAQVRVDPRGRDLLIALAFFGEKLMRRAPPNSQLVIGTDQVRLEDGTIRVYYDVRLYQPRPGGNYDVERREVDPYGDVRASRYQSPEPPLQGNGVSWSTTLRLSSMSLFNLTDAAFRDAEAELRRQGIPTELARDYMALTQPAASDYIRAGAQTLSTIDRATVRGWLSGKPFDFTIDMDDASQARFLEMVNAVRRLRGGPLRELAKQRSAEILSYFPKE